MKNYDQFFAKAGESVLHTNSYGESIYSVSVEELYQHFKKRMMEELSVDVAEQTYCGKLVELDKLAGK